MSELKEVSDLSNVELLDQYRKDRGPMDELVVAPTINLQKVVKEELLHRLDQLPASQSRERVYREALEVTVEALDNLVGQLPTDGRLTEFQLDLQEQALVVARAALTNNKLDEEKE